MSTSGRRALVAAASFPALLSAAELVYEPFDYGADNLLAGESGGAGWFDGWTQDGESCVVRSSGLNYTDLSGNALDTAGASLDTSGTATTRNFREMSDRYEDAWISCLFNLSATNSKFEGINFYRGATTVFAISNSSADPSPTITLNNFVNNSTAGTGKGQFGVTHFVVLKLSRNSGSDQIEVFVDPLLGEVPSTPDAVINASDFSFDRVRIAAQDGATLFVDELRVGETFADVSPHMAVSVTDSDGDGLSDAQEDVLGLDPFSSDADLIAAIQDHPDFFGLHDSTGMLTLTKGGVILPKTGDDPIDFTFEVQQSEDLSSWPTLETYTRSVDLPGDKNYLRVTLQHR